MRIELTPEMKRQMGKSFYFNNNSSERTKEAGLALLEEAKNQGDPEASYIIGTLYLDRAQKRGDEKCEDYALSLICYAANSGFIQARTFLNSYCEDRYNSSVAQKANFMTEPGPLVDFEGKRIVIDRTGLLTPVDAVLEYRDGRNILTLSTNVAFAYREEIPNSDIFEAAVLKGISLWQGEYEVFNGQKITVQINITMDSRIFDNLIVVPLTESYKNIIKSSANLLGTKKKKAEIDNMIREKRSFASSGIKWSVKSRKLICIQSEDGKFDDCERIKHIVKHEFGHALGLGDLYENQSDSLVGVDRGSYPELDSYAIGNRLYNLVMCDYLGPISNNDIEMVILAFRENKIQLYQPQDFKGKISSALGKGN